MTKHYSLFDSETANLIEWFHNEERANEVAAELYRVNPEAKPGEFVVIEDEEECGENCDAE